MCTGAFHCCYHHFRHRRTEKAGTPKVARSRNFPLPGYRNASGGNRISGKHNVGVNRDRPAGSLPQWRATKRVDRAAIDYHAVKPIRLTFHGVTEYGMIAVGRGFI